MNEMRQESGPVCGALLYSLMQAGHAVQQRLDAGLQPYGLSLPKIVLLHHLIRAEAPLPLSELSARLGCAKSNVTQLVDRLEADALVERLADPADRRSKLAAITPAGRERYAAARHAIAAAEQEILAGLAAPARTELAGLLDHFGPVAVP